MWVCQNSLKLGIKKSNTNHQTNSYLSTKKKCRTFLELATLPSRAIHLVCYTKLLKHNPPLSTISVMRFESSRAISVMSTKKVEEEPQAARVAENSPGGSNSWFIISMSARASTSYHISSFNLTLR